MHTRAVSTKSVSSSYCALFKKNALKSHLAHALHTYTHIYIHILLLYIAQTQSGRAVVDLNCTAERKFEINQFIEYRSENGLLGFNNNDILCPLRAFGPGDDDTQRRCAVQLPSLWCIGAQRENPTQSVRIFCIIARQSVRRCTSEYLLFVRRLRRRWFRNCSQAYDPCDLRGPYCGCEGLGVWREGCWCRCCSYKLCRGITLYCCVTIKHPAIRNLIGLRCRCVPSNFYFKTRIGEVAVNGYLQYEMVINAPRMGFDLKGKTTNILFSCD